MNIYLWISLIVFILIIGIAFFSLLIKKYRDKLLDNFSQKIWMTICLGAIYTCLYLAGTAVLVIWIKNSLGNGDLFAYLKNPWFLIRIGLGFFVLNAFLILAVRSVIKRLYYLNL